MMASTSRAARAVLRLARSSRAGPSTIVSPLRAATAPAFRRPSPLSSTFARFASTSSDPPSASDPTLDQVHDLLEQGTRELEEGSLDGAKRCYEQSIAIQPTSGAWFNLGVCEYHLKNNEAAVKAWEKSVELEPSADAYTNMASAYVLAQPPQPALAIKHLTSALELAPSDPEIAYNLAAVLESTDNLETSLKMYERAQKGGIERASQNIRNVGAKILSKKAQQEQQQ